MLGLRELIGEDGHHTQHVDISLTECCDSLEAGATGGDEVFDDNNVPTLLDLTFDEVAHAMVLGSRTHIDEGYAEGIGNKGTLCDGSSGHTCDGIDLVAIDALYGADETRLDDGADVGEGEGLAIVAIDG